MTPEEKKKLAEDAHKLRLQQAEELLRLFEEDNGHPPTSVEELNTWAGSQRGQNVINLRSKKLKPRDHSKN